MKDHHREKNETRARALATSDRNYWVSLLQTVDTWFPVYRVKHPDADRAKIVARLASLVDERRRRGFSEQEKPGPALPATAVHFEAPLALRRIKGVFDDTIFGATTSGVAKASAFKRFDVENPSRSDTKDLHKFAPLGGSFADTHAALFWTGFERLDSTWDQIDVFTDSPSDRAVNMAVLQVNLPPPTSRVIARMRTSMFITLAQGVEIINDWGWFDDEDDASLKIDFCGAFTRDGQGFPDPSAFGFFSAMSFSSSTHKFQSQDADMSRTVVLNPGDKPSLFLGMRWTFAAADTRMQTGFKQEELNAFFGFQQPDNGRPGVAFSYEPELVIAQ